MLRSFVLSLVLASSLHGDEAAHLHKALYDAAAATNRAKFTSTLERAQTFIETMPLGERRNRLRRAIITATDLDRLWQYDGFYWDEQSLPDYYDRLAGEYADFERFITPHRLIDGGGKPFYPVRETRDFLLKRLRPANSRKSEP